MSPTPDLDSRQRRAAAAWNLTDEIVLIFCGEQIGIPGGLDQTYPFKPHPEYYWLTNERRPGSVIAFDPKEGWTHFIRPVDAVERMWERIESEPVGTPLDQLDRWLSDRKGRKRGLLGSFPLGIERDPDLSMELSEKLGHARRPKDEFEIELVKRACKATAKGFAAACKAITPGATERQVQLALEFAAMEAGADEMGYHTIVGTGSNSAVFHFSPGPEKLLAGDLVLIDAGAMVQGYTADVTRTYAADGKFATWQKDLYDVVLQAEVNACSRCVVGAEWLEIHRDTAREMAQGLVDLGYFACSADQAVETEAIALFFPHGVGHCVGLGVRDTGGREPGRESRKSAGINVRVDLILRDGYLMTVEPGLYFVPAILTNPSNRDRFANEVNWDLVDTKIGFGGIRIEDNILITNSGPENLTSTIPK